MFYCINSKQKIRWRLLRLILPELFQNHPKIKAVALSPLHQTEALSQQLHGWKRYPDNTYSRQLGVYHRGRRRLNTPTTNSHCQNKS